MSEPTIDEQKSFYDDRWATTIKRPTFHQHLKNRICGIRRMMELINLQNPTILEVGCGLGHISNELSKFGTVQAMDLSPKAITIAQERYPQVRFCQGDVFNYDFGGTLYDILVTSEVIEHFPLENRKEFVKILRKRLKPDGWLILTTPNKKVSDKLTKEQPIENHFFEPDLKHLLSLHFDVKYLVTVQNFLPVLCHKYRLFQLLRAFIYDILSLRSFLENPSRGKSSGLYFVVLAKCKESLG